MYLDIEVCKMSELRRKDKITVEMKMRPAFCATLASASLARLLICCFCFCACACVPFSAVFEAGIALVLPLSVEAAYVRSEFDGQILHGFSAVFDTNLYELTGYKLEVGAKVWGNKELGFAHVGIPELEDATVYPGLPACGACGACGWDQNACYSTGGTLLLTISVIKISISVI